MPTLNLDAGVYGTLRVGDTVKIHFPGNSVSWGRVVNKDNIYYPQNVASVAAETTNTAANVTDLDPTGNILHEFTRLEIIGNVRVLLRHPPSTNKWGTIRAPTSGFLDDQISPLGAGKPVDFFVFEDYPPNVQITNNTDVAIAPRLWWYGYQYNILFINSPSGTQPVYTEVFIGGIVG